MAEMEMEQEWDLLRERYLDDELSAADEARLRSLLADPALCDRFLDEVGDAHLVEAGLADPGASLERLRHLRRHNRPSATLRTVDELDRRRADAAHPRPPGGRSAGRLRRRRARRGRSVPAAVPVLLAVAAGLVLLLWWAMPARDPVPDGAGVLARVVAVTGTAQLREAGPLRPGDAVGPGDALLLASGASVRVRYDDGTEVALADGARCAWALAGDAKRIELQSGTLSASVASQPADAPFAVITPHARATVLGTRFTLAVEDARSRLAVDHGRVRVAPPGGAAVEVAAGHSWRSDVGAVVVAAELGRVAGDMVRPHASPPSGVPASTGWTDGPRIGEGIRPPAGWTHVLAWGQLYLADGAAVPDGVRVAVRDLRLYRFSRSRRSWELVQRSEAVAGAAYPEDYAGNAAVTADLRPHGDGGVEVAIAAGRNVLFWIPAGRVAFDPADVGGWYCCFQARLVPAAPGAAVPRDPRIMASAGGDYWRDAAAPWAPGGANNRDIAIGRFRFVGRDWGWHHMHTMDEATIRANPPPTVVVGTSAPTAGPAAVP